MAPAFGGEDMSEERRQHPRSPANFSVRLGPLAGETPATARNLSLSGINCIADRPFEEMTVLEMRLPLPRATPPHAAPGASEDAYDVLLCRGAVVRCDPVEGTPGRYEVAVYFTDLPPGGRERLEAYLESTASGPP